MTEHMHEAPRRWGIYLRRARKAMGYGSARELSRRLGISPAMITQVEGGIRRPSALVVQKELIDLVGISPTEQEQVLWGLTFQFRASVRRLALAILLHYQQSLPNPLSDVWKDTWNTSDPAEAENCQWKLEDGQLVDWLLATTYDVGWEFFDINAEATRALHRKRIEPPAGFTDSLTGKTVPAVMTAHLRWPRMASGRIRVGVTDLVINES